MHNFRPDHGPTVDKPWNDLSRAWNDLSRAWNDLSLGRGTAYLERGQGYESFQLISFFLLQQNFGSSPKKGNNLDFNLDTLDGARIQKQRVLRLSNILGPYSGLFLQYMFRSLGRNLLFLIGLMTYDGIFPGFEHVSFVVRSCVM